MEKNNEILVDLNYLGKLLKEQSLEQNIIRDILLDLIEKSNFNSPLIIQKSTVNEIVDKLFDEPKVELSEFDKALQKALNFNPKKK